MKKKKGGGGSGYGEVALDLTSGTYSTCSHVQYELHQFHCRVVIARLSEGLCCSTFLSPPIKVSQLNKALQAVRMDAPSHAGTPLKSGNTGAFPSPLHLRSYLTRRVLSNPLASEWWTEGFPATEWLLAEVA